MKPTNHFSIVRQVWDASGDLPRKGATGQEREANAAALLRLVVAEIRKHDPTAGLWLRSDRPWGHDTDKVCFKMPQGGVFFVDIIGAAGSPWATPTWQDGDENYDPAADLSRWVPSMEPEPAPVPVPLPTPTPTPTTPTPVPGIPFEFSVLTSHGYLSLQPDGTVQFRDPRDAGVPGAWERFKLVLVK